MVQELQLPELGENINSGAISRVLVNVGDMVSVDQPVIEIETEKAVVEVPSSFAGTVTEVRVKAGQTVKVGETILLISSEERAVAKEPEQVTAPPPAEKVTPKPEPMAKKIEQPKPEAPAERPSHKEQQPEPQPTRPSPAAALWERHAHPPVAAAPSVRRLARDLGVDLNEVAGSGPGGRISAADVHAHLEGREPAPRETKPPQAKAPAARKERPAPEKPAEKRVAQKPPAGGAERADQWGAIERVPMSAVRRKTAQHIGVAWQTIPHVTHFDQADSELLESFRKQYGNLAAEFGGKLTVTVIMAKIVALALKKFPQFNASVDMEKQEIILKKYVNIGIAVDTEHGLLVPVLRDADYKGMLTMAAEIGELAERARNRKLAPDDMQGGTFTITNLGGIGGSNFTPIINAPEVAILGISRARPEPVLREGAFQPRPMLPLALSYDHRVIDGADAARFTRFLVQAIEQPYTILLEETELL